MIALHDATRRPDFTGRIVGVLSDQRNAGGLLAARERGLETAAVPREPSEAKRAHEARVLDRIRAWQPELVCLAGYMRILSPELIDALGGWVLNIHPSLLPSFPGLDTHARAIEAGAKRHGCTVHWVTPGVDEGPIVAQEGLDVRPGETAEALGARVLALEHRLYPLAVAKVLGRTA